MHYLLSLFLLLAPSVFASGPLTRVVNDMAFSSVGMKDAALWRTQSAADQRIYYGALDNPHTFGDLRLPLSNAPESGFPVIVFLHGGAWRKEVTKAYNEPLVEALTETGFATWDLEFRRLGHSGGGYPGTFEDIANGLDYLRQLAGEYPLDLDNVVVMGHSSGGHLALWLAGRSKIRPDSPLFKPDPLPLSGAVSIAGVNDLELALALGNRTDVLELAGAATLEEGRDRLADIDPARLLPLGVPQTLIIGDGDSEWRLDMTERYLLRAHQQGDTVRQILVTGANHMDIVDPHSGIAQLLAKASRDLLRTAAEPDATVQP